MATKSKPSIPFHAVSSSDMPSDRMLLIDSSVSAQIDCITQCIALKAFCDGRTELNDAKQKELREEVERIAQHAASNKRCASLKNVAAADTTKKQ